MTYEHVKIVEGNNKLIIKVLKSDGNWIGVEIFSNQADDKSNAEILADQLESDEKLRANYIQMALD